MKVLFSTFPFVVDADHSVALSFLLTTMARRALDFAPMHAFDSPTAGTGKSMITDIVSIIAMGDRAGVIPHTENVQEFDKLLSSILMSVPLDNCEGPLKGVLLSQTLTQAVVLCRILGKSEHVPVRTNATVTANGNNLVIEGDITRRAICGRMDAGVERPELLKFEYSPLDDAMNNRPELVICALTILRAYHLAGRPSRETLGSFQQWSNLVRGSLLWLGEPDPAATMEELRRNDPRQLGLKTVMVEWVDQFKCDTRVNVSTMIERANRWEREIGFRFPAWRDALMQVAGVGSAVNNRKLGTWLGKNKNRPMVFHDKPQQGKERRVTLKIIEESKSMGRQMWVLQKKEEFIEKQEQLL
jgi:hypothetical protein